MTEREIRAILRDVLTDLDRRASQAARKVVLPSMLGVSLALSGGCGDRSVALDSSPPTADGTLRADFGGPWPAYAVPEYMAPEPDWGPEPPDMALSPDMGPVPEYMAPEPDIGPVQDALAPAPDGVLTPPPTPAPMYGAPEPADDSGA